MDREELNIQRLKEYEVIQTLIDIIEDIKEYPDDLVLQERVQKAQMLIHKRMQPQAEYSAMIKAALKNSSHSLSSPAL